MSEQIFLWRAWNDAHERLCDSGWLRAGDVLAARRQAWQLIGGPYLDTIADIEVVSITKMLVDDERDRLARELADVRDENRQLRATEVSVNDAINRAGIHCAITFAEAIDQLRGERDRMHDEAARAQRVERQRRGDRYVAFVAHPVAGDVAANILNAKRWLRWLMLSEPTTSFIAPWLTAIEAGANDEDPAERERGIRDNEAALARCDGLVLVGGRISTGMARELALAEQLDQDVDDLTFLGWEVPICVIPSVLSRSFDELAAAANLGSHDAVMRGRRASRRRRGTR